MEWIASFKRRLKTWAEGSPPINDKMIKTIHDEAWVLLYMSCTFLDLRENVWIFSIIALITSYLSSLAYMILMGIVAYMQRANFAEASRSAHMAALQLVTLVAFSSTNYYRKAYVEFIRAWSENFFDYGDDFQIPEMEEEKRISKRTQTIIFVALPTYFVLTGICAVSGRALDEYFDVAQNETYVNGVYMLTPMPMWFPFTVDSVFTRFLANGSFVVAAFAVAMAVGGVNAVIIFFNQALILQLKTVTYRLRKIEQCAYRLCRKNGRKTLAKSTMFNDPNFLKCYNFYLIKIAQHHQVIIDNFQRVQQLTQWTTGVAVIIGSIMIAMSIFAVLLGGGSPSMMSLGGMLTVAEIINIGMICAMSEQVLQVGNALHEELYGLNWMDLNLPAKRTMMMMIARTKKPLLLKGGITPLTWQTFSTIMNSSYTYLNLLIASRA